MNGNDLIDALGKIDLKTVEESAPKRRKRTPRPWIIATAAVLAAAIALGIFFRKGGFSPTSAQPPVVLRAYALSEAVYPSCTPYPTDEYGTGYEAWRADRAAKQVYFGAGRGLTPFFVKSGAEILGARRENTVFSPLNAFLALSMLGEISGGETRKEILGLLGIPDIETLRDTVFRLWNASYSDDGALTSVPGSSLWLQEGASFNRETLETLASKYYASAFSGSFGDETYIAALRDWINAQTGNLLSEAANALQPGPETVLMLLSTLYFRAEWETEFRPEATEPGAFHALEADLTCDFMHQTLLYGTYYGASRFGAVALGLREGGNMWFFLPDEGISPEELYADPEYAAFLEMLQTPGDDEWEHKKSLRINLSLPKFDVSSNLDLKEALQALGVTVCFTGEADFTPLSADLPLTVSGVRHAARAAVDETGVTAAAFTAVDLAGGAMPPEEEMDFVLDRPFGFVITGLDGMPLFMGSVFTP